MQPDQAPSAQQPNPFQTTIPMSQEEFNRRYWFNSLQMVTVVNPKAQDYPFMVEGRHFIIRGGASERYPGVIANVYLDNMSKIMAQDDDRLGYMGDPNLKRLYYDKLIANVESLVQEHNPLPAYMQNVPQHTIAPAPTDRAPWDTALGERASDIPASPPTSYIAEPPIAPPVAPPAPEPKPTPEPAKPAEVKAETKEFVHDDMKYKMVIGKDGRRLYYRNGQLTNADTYNKAASML